MGDANAPIVMEMYGGYEDPFSARFWQDSLPLVKENYISQGKVQFIFRHFPLEFHTHSMEAAEVAECAAEQNKFWEVSNDLFLGQRELGEDFYIQIVSEHVLDIDQFNKCRESDSTLIFIQKDIALGKELGTSGTPTFFINKKRIVGAVPYSTFEQALNEALGNEVIEEAVLEDVPKLVPAKMPENACTRAGYKCTSGIRGCGWKYQIMDKACEQDFLICCENIGYCGDNICDTNLDGYGNTEDKLSCPQDCDPNYKDEIIAKKLEAQKEMDKEKNILEETIKTEKQGCEIDGTRVPYGYRYLVDNQYVYCTIKNEWLPQKEKGIMCINNHECRSNQCVNDVCVDLQEQIDTLKKQTDENTSLLQKIMSFFRNFFR